MYIAQIASGAAALVKDYGQDVNGFAYDRFDTYKNGGARFVSNSQKAANDSRFPKVDDIIDRLNSHTDLADSRSKPSK